MFLKSKLFSLLILLVLVLVPIHISARTIGEVSTVFRAFAPNDKIVIESFSDPDIPQVICYLSRAKTGGFSGAVGVAEDGSDASVFCLKKGIITKVDKNILNGKADGDHVFKKSTSLVFKTIQVVRFYDKESHTLVYLAYSDKVLDGSPKNSVTAVSIN